MSDRKQYAEKMKSKIDLWDAEIDRIKARLEVVEADAKVEYQKQLEEMRAKRDEAKSRLKEIHAASDDAWDDMKTGFDKAWDHISSAFDSARSRFK